MPVQYKIIIFIIASVGITWLSWSSLRNFHSHGFYRFFAFESIVALVLLNLDYWFNNPFSVHQIIAWSLLIISLYLVIHGGLLLHKLGKPDKNRNDGNLLRLEKTSNLVTNGVYRYIRHPLYSSLLFLTWGVFFKHPSWIGITLALTSTFFLIMTAKIEEIENVNFFGEAYKIYMKKTKMFITFLLQ